MKLSFTLLALASLQIAAAAIVPPETSNAEQVPEKRQGNTWPNGPLVTSGRLIRDTTGASVKYAGANWPGAGEVMIPEGLQYQSIQTIVSKIGKGTGGLGMNAIRLTFAIQMIDEIYSNGGKDITLQKAFVQALGQANGTKVLNQVLTKNPGLNASTTRLEVGCPYYLY